MSVYVIREGLPSAERPRWCGPRETGFDDLDDAVAAGLERAQAVLVRTLDGTRYLAGRDPRGGTAARPWPPSAQARREIDAEYGRRAAEERLAGERAAAFERARDAWLADHGPHLIGVPPAFACSVVRDVEETRSIVFQELDAQASICAAHDQYGSMGFGSAREALAGAAGRPTGDGWVRATELALRRSWSEAPPWRRSALWVGCGRGELFHVSPTVNRASIAEHGLDWRRMSGSGIAGSSAPEAEGIFLCGSNSDMGFFAGMRSDPCDVWAVQVDDLWLEGDPGADGGGSDHWVIATQPIAPQRLRLVHREIRGDRGE